MEIIRKTAQTLIYKLGSAVPDPTRTAALFELRHLTKNKPDIRHVIADKGAIPCLAELLYSNTLVDLDNAAAILLNVSISCSEALMSTPNILHALSHALTRHHPSVVHSASATIYSLLIDEDNRPVVGSCRGIVLALIDIVGTRGYPDESLREALKALLGVALCPLNRPGMVKLGAPAALLSVIEDEWRVVGVVEDATAVIAELAGIEESPSAFRGVSGIRILVDLLNMDLSWSGRVRENSVHGLLNLVHFGGGDVVEEIREFGCGFVFHGLKMMVENGGVQGREKAQELINILDEASALGSPLIRVQT